MYRIFHYNFTVKFFFSHCASEMSEYASRSSQHLWKEIISSGCDVGFHTSTHFLFFGGGTNNVFLYFAANIMTTFNFSRVVSRGTMSTKICVMPLFLFLYMMRKHSAKPWRKKIHLDVNSNLKTQWIIIAPTVGLRMYGSVYVHVSLCSYCKSVSVCVFEYRRDAFQNRSLLIPLKNEHSPRCTPSEWERESVDGRSKRKDNKLWIRFKRDIAPWPPHCFSFLSSSLSSPSLFSLCVLCLLLNRYGLTVMGQWPVCIRLDCNRGALCLPGLSVEVITPSYLKPLFKGHPLSI